MEVKEMFRCFALIYLLFNFGYSLTVGKNQQNVLQEETPEEFVEETEKTVKSVNHLREMTDKMNDYLNKNSPDPKMFCEENLGTCRALVERYLNRCKKGDCYTFDHLVVFSAPDKLSLRLPHLAQYEMAKYVFDKSGARQGLWKRFLDKFRKEKGERSLVEFNKELLKRNLAQLNMNGVDDQSKLNEVFYSLTVYYQRYLNDNRFKTFRMSYGNRPLSMAFFSLRHRRLLNRLVEEVVGEKVLGVSHSDLKSMVDSFALYLTVGNYRPRPKFAVVFCKLAKHAVSKSLGYKKVSFLMADRLLEYPVDPNTYCKANADVTCKENLVHYLKRCDEGDCTTFDNVDLLDPKDWLNVKVPVLPEVAASFDLFTQSRAMAPNWFKRLLLRQFNRMTLDRFKTLLYERNALTVSFKTKNQGYLHRYLYLSSLDFVYRARKTKWNVTPKNASSTLMKNMSSVVGNNKVYLEVPRVKSVLVSYRNYLYKSGFDLTLETVNKYASDLQHALFSYLHDPHQGEYTDQYSEEWKKLKEKELKKAEAKAEEELGKKEKKEKKKTWKNLWGLVKDKTEDDEGVEPELDKLEPQDDLATRKTDLNQRLDNATELFRKALNLQ